MSKLACRRNRHRGIQRVFLVIVSALLLSLMSTCTDEEGGSPGREGESEGPPAEEWTLSPSPRLEIGVLEGTAPYQLHRVGGAVRLDDGRVVVLNGGSRELRYYDGDGRYLGAVGQDGEGPGEFRNPTRLRRSADGGLLVWDRGLMRASLFTVEGDFQRSFRLLASRQELFPGDQWVLGQNWIESPVSPGDREPIRRAVEALPPPDSTGGLRVVRVTRQGRLWVPDRRLPADAPVTWHVYGLDGERVAEVSTPSRFQPAEIGEDYITGVFLDDVDVNYVRVYDLAKPPGSSPGPGLDRSGEPGRERAGIRSASGPEDVLASVRSLVKTLASLQEIYYSDHLTYTRDLQNLFRGSGARGPDDLAVEILFAGSQGWAGMVSHNGTDARCILGYGSFLPMGWQPGAVVCL